LFSRSLYRAAHLTSASTGELRPGDRGLSALFLGRLPADHVAQGKARDRHEEGDMSVYKVIEVIGTSATSWEDAAAEAVKTAGETLHDLRVAEVVKQDLYLDESGEITFRTKLQLSFKYQHER
jgi:flavin-binding protein dodecin